MHLKLLEIMLLIWYISLHKLKIKSYNLGYYSIHIYLEVYLIELNWDLRWFSQ